MCSDELPAKSAKFGVRSTDPSTGEPPKRPVEKRPGVPIDVFSTQLTARQQGPKRLIARHPSGPDERIGDVATPEPIQPSHRLRQAADAERRRLVKALDRAGRRAASLRVQLDETEAEIAGLTQRLTLVAQLAGNPGDRLHATADAADVTTRDDGASESPTPILAEPLHGYLRGSTIRIVAVRLLLSSPAASQPIHYQDWLDLVRAAGYDIAGRDPAASFLTALSRSPVVARAGEPGMYAVVPATLGDLRGRLEVLNEELLALHHGQQTIEEIASARERRAELVAEIARVERALEEAIESLGADGAAAV